VRKDRRFTAVPFHGRTGTEPGHLRANRAASAGEIHVDKRVVRSGDFPTPLSDGMLLPQATVASLSEGHHLDYFCDESW
jgi:hypothetical protein